MSQAPKDSDVFQQVVQSAVAQLVNLEINPSGHYITMPLMYASGGYVVVRVQEVGDEYFVSDFGAGFEESQLIGGDRIFRRLAPGVAQANGVQFDSFAFFVLKVSSGQLAGAIATIANSSQEAVNLTALKVSEQKHRDANALLYERLTSVFSRDSVARDAQIVGASNHEWHVGSLVTLNRRQVAFEAVSKHPNSIVYAATKFSDIARARKAPDRVAVVQSKKSLGTYLGVLSHDASVIEKRAEDRVYRGLLQAA